MSPIHFTLPIGQSVLHKANNRYKAGGNWAQGRLEGGPKPRSDKPSYRSLRLALTSKNDTETPSRLFTHILIMVLTGIELALGVIPLIIAVTAYSRKAFEKSKTASRQKVKNEKLLDFYQSLHAEIALLGITLESLVSDLPTIPEQQKAQLLKHDRKQWNDVAVAVALSERLGGAEDAFKDILDTILKTLENIISDRSLHLVGADIVCS
jgi:hypothetical protein